MSGYHQFPDDPRLLTLTFESLGDTWGVRMHAEPYNRKTRQRLPLVLVHRGYMRRLSVPLRTVEDGLALANEYTADRMLPGIG